MMPFTFPVEFNGDYAAIPAHMQAAIRRYVEQGVAPGDFLSAIIKNDLRGAIGHADAENEPLLKLYVQWFYNVAPALCSGSPEIMTAWMTARRQDSAALV